MWQLVVASAMSWRAMGVPMLRPVSIEVLFSYWKGHMKAKLKALVAALASKEARGPELALARLIVAALGIKLGVNFAEWL